MPLKFVLLIDADNVSADFAPQIFDKLAALGNIEIITRRAYGNMSAFSGNKGWKDAVRKYAIEAFPQVNILDRKNMADFALIIDAMDCLASGKYDGFVLTSSDSDFTSLAQRLRNEDKLVYGFGDDRVSESFRVACARFFELKQERKDNITNVSEVSHAEEKVESKHVTEPSTQAAAQQIKLEPGKQNVKPSNELEEQKKLDPTKEVAASTSVKELHDKLDAIARGMVICEEYLNETTEWSKIAEKLKERGCKKEKTLLNYLVKNLKKKEDEANKIIQKLKNQKKIMIDANGNITWN